MLQITLVVRDDPQRVLAYWSVTGKFRIAHEINKVPPDMYKMVLRLGPTKICTAESNKLVCANGLSRG